MISQLIIMIGDRESFGYVPDLGVAAAGNTNKEGSLIRIRIHGWEVHEICFFLSRVSFDLFFRIQRIGEISFFSRFQEAIESIQQRISMKDPLSGDLFDRRSIKRCLFQVQTHNEPICVWCDPRIGHDLFQSILPGKHIVSSFCTFPELLIAVVLC